MFWAALELQRQYTTNMDVKEFQNRSRYYLERIFTGTEIKTEWSAEISQYNIYSPRLDIAVGPFALEERLIKEYDDQQSTKRIFIEGLIDLHNSNIRDYYPYYISRTYDNVTSVNLNARCFLAIEIENQVSRKHLIGGAMNASALGRIGVFIAYTEKKFLAMKKLEGYFNFLSTVGKNSFNTKNLLILSKSQFMDYICNFNGCDITSGSN